MPTVRTLTPDGHLEEIADRIWVARHEAFDVSTTVIGGSRGLLIVDTLWSEQAGLRLRDRIAALGAGEVVGVVNTHVHVDHVLGNAAFPGVPLHAHDSTAAAYADHLAEVRAGSAGGPDHPDEQTYRAEMLASQPREPDTTLSSVAVVDLGDRAVELLHPGPGHTSGDVVVRIEDADVLLAGDLVEESGPPGFGADCFPMSWPKSLDLVIGLIGAGTVVVPGHGDPVDQDYVEEQRSAIGVVAETIRDLAGRGVAVSEALGAAEWPYPSERLADAVRRGYVELPRSAKHLPLI